ncbi:hypothetical protein [Georgenia yuyongxinii]|uniref:Uncharacterized protein n=1 Tax=Georgenia yuyongxinii TaxID=2589797 RepID=A0A552WUI0_9MICO|nr:hypothetical protein [Georgenia yuyongxinii]TRW46407.1 hypothetical protein FJ693_05630 [Georgenia yuyongxinii]
MNATLTEQVLARVTHAGHDWAIPAPAVNTVDDGVWERVEEVAWTTYAAWCDTNGDEELEWEPRADRTGWTAAWMINDDVFDELLIPVVPDNAPAKQHVTPVSLVAAVLTGLDEANQRRVRQVEYQARVNEV